MGFPKGLKPLFGFKLVEIIMMTLPSLCFRTKKKTFGGVMETFPFPAFPNAGMRLLDFISFQNPPMDL